MKVLVCDIGLEKEFLGIEESSVRELAEARVFSVPWNVSGFHTVVESSKELHPIVGVSGILGNGEIRVFVILRSGYAIGINSVVGYQELNEKLEVPDDLKKYFKEAFRYEDSVVYILKEDGAKYLPKVDVPNVPEKRSSELKEDKQKDRKLKKDREFLVLYIGSEKYAVKKEDISEVSDSSRVNIMEMESLYGFMQSSGRVVVVLSKWKIKPRWIIVLKSVAIPCESFEVLNSELLKADGKEFVVRNGEQIDVLSEEELRTWI